MNLSKFYKVKKYMFQLVKYWKYRSNGYRQR